MRSDFSDHRPHPALERRSRRASARWACALLVAMLLSGCGSLLGPEAPTPFPTEYLPTVIALTLEAGRTAQAGDSQPSPTATPTAHAEPPAAETATPKPSLQPPVASTPEAAGPSATPYTLEPSISPTATPEIPNAEIEIRNLGAFSRVSSPLHILSYLKTGAGGKVTIELLGEDRRLLARQIKVIDYAPVGGGALVLADLDFEVAAAAEAGRLQISTADEYGRTVALNSVPLILLSIGDADITPPLDVLAPIILRTPTRQTLVQGGKLLVSGLARPESDQPLFVQLVTQQGAVLGTRLASVEIDQPGSYASFAAEVPYQVSTPTRVLVVVTEGEGSLQNVIHLASIEVMLSP